MAAQMAGQPILILREGTGRTVGRDAQRTNIMAARIIAESVKSTLGPRGMDKMLVDGLGDIVVTNDGATILKEMDVEHPAAKMVVEIAKTQESEVGDGTTTVAIIGGELLKRAEELLDLDIHSTIIANGYRMAAEKAKEFLNDISISVDKGDKDVLKKVAMTTMTGKGVEKSREYLADIMVSAVEEIAEDVDGETVVDSSDIKLEKKEGSSIEDTELIQGIVLDKERVHPAMPKKVEGAKIALLDSAIEIEKTEFDAEIRITDPTQLKSFIYEEEDMLKHKVEKVKDSGANVLICQKGIDDLAQHYLSKAGIFAIRRAKKSDIEKLSKATGASIVTNIEDLSKDDLGYAGIVEEVRIGDDEMTFVRECRDPKAVTILIRGGSEHVINEVERTLEDCLGVLPAALEDGKLVAGGGAPEIEVAKRLRDYAKTIGGREQLAIEAFADSIEVVPRTLAENAGLDPIDMIVALRAKHGKSKEGTNFGLDIAEGKPKDMYKEGVVEPTRVKTQAISSASEVAVMILRIDDVIASSSSRGGPSMPPESGEF